MLSGERIRFVDINAVNLVSSANNGKVDIFNMAIIAVHAGQTFIGEMQYYIRKYQPDDNNQNDYGQEKFTSFSFS
ncbi:MAG: hypothetical protein H7Z75_14890 [Ferruginibacter sp.]|nr:hypothetical protein [Cytophagales bacterium]